MLENKRAETLRLLRESGKNVSGQELCEHFGISRTAVWKIMNQLKEEGYEVVLLNSNPATIMTDTKMADKVYMEPLTLEYVARIIRYERPDAIVPGLGGQTGLNLCVQLGEKGILEECQVEVLGTKISSIQKAEDRELFKEILKDIKG